MGHMEVFLIVITGYIEMTRSEVEFPYILWIEEVTDASSILVLVLGSTMIVIVIILTEGVIGDNFRMILRKKIHLHLMER